MRDKLALALIEQADGTVAVQMFESPESGRKAFENLVDGGTTAVRATFLDISFRDGPAVAAESFELPRNRPFPTEWRLGAGDPAGMESNVEV